MWSWTIAVATWACDRALPPPSGLAAAADAIVVARGEGNQIQVERVLRGEVRQGRLNARIEPLCGMAEPLPNAAWLYHLRHDPEGWVVLADGRFPVGNGVPVPVLEALANADRARWSEVTDGWSTLLVEEEPRPDAPPGTTVVAGIRNFGPAARTITWTDWPRTNASHVTLDVLGPAGPVQAVPTGIDDQATRTYLAANGRHFEITLQPGEFWLFTLPLIDAAPAGWGYKEELDFRYYPLATPGAYSVTAHLLNLTDPPLPPTTPLHITR
jgi:hypothetical protein